MNGVQSSESSHVRIGVNLFPPLIFECAVPTEKLSNEIASDCKMAGSWLEVTDFIIRAAGLKPTFVKVPVQSFKFGSRNVDQDGTVRFSGVQKLLQANEIDVTPLNFAFSEEKIMDGFQFSFPIEIEFGTFLVPAGREPLTLLSKALKLMSPFEPLTWLTVFLFVSALYFLNYLPEITGKTLKVRYQKVISLVLSFSVLFFSSLYQGLLLTSLMLNPPDTFLSHYDLVVEAVDTGAVKMMFSREKSLAARIINKDPAYAALKNALIKNPAVFERSPAKFLPMVESGDYIRTVDDSVSAYLLSSSCNVESVRVLEYGPLSLMFAPGFNKTDAVNQAILGNYEAIAKILSKYSKFYAPFNHEETCTAKFGPKPTRETSFKVIELGDLYGCFLLWGLGMLFAILIYALQQIGWCSNLISSFDAIL